MSRRSPASMPMTVAAFLLAGACGGPVTDGVRTELPSRADRIIVWGDHPAAVATARIWFQRQGLTVLEIPGPMPASVTGLAQTAVDAGASHVAVIRHVGDLRAPMVSVSGMDTAGVTRWTGTARYPAYTPRPLSDSLVRLTCRALETAWGITRAGRSWFNSGTENCGVSEGLR